MMEQRNLFGKELKKLRKEARYTQGQLAKFAKISVSYISQLETGTKQYSELEGRAYIKIVLFFCLCFLIPLARKLH